MAWAWCAVGKLGDVTTRVDLTNPASVDLAFGASSPPAPLLLQHQRAVRTIIAFARK